MKTPSFLVVILVFVAGSLTAESSEKNNALTTTSGFAATNEDGPPQYLLAFGKVTVGGKDVETAIQWNTKTGEARMLNAASFSDKSTGKEGNLVGWVPLIDLQQAIQNLSTDIKARQGK